MTSTCFQHPHTGSQLANGRTRGWTHVHSMPIPLLVFGVVFCLALNGFAQARDSGTTEQAGTSWTAVTESKRDNVVPARIIESHSQEGNRTVDRRSVQMRRYAGHFEFYEESERETLHVDAETTRTTTRTFAQDANGRKILVDITEESKHTLPSGDSTIARILSRSDLNGSLQVVQREMVETRSIGNDTEQTNTTLLLPSVNGGFAPAVKTEEITKRSANDTVASQTTLLRDGAGNWQVREVRQSTTRQWENNVSKEERVFRCNAEGKLVEVSRLVGKESESTLGEKRDLVETYSLHIAGATPNGSLQLVERATSMQHTTATGEQITAQQVEQRNLGNPDSGLRLSILINDTLRPGPDGTQATRTIRTRDANAGFEVIEVDTTKADKVLTLHISHHWNHSE